MKILNNLKNNLPLLRFLLFGILISIIILQFLNYKTKLTNKEKELKEYESFVKAKINYNENELLKKETSLHFNKTLNDLYKVTVKITNEDKKLLGGASNILLKLNNPCSYNFKFIKVAVRHFKANGELYKVDNVTFFNVLPNTEQIEQAPNSNRGTSIKTEIIAYDSPDLPKTLNKN